MELKTPLYNLEEYPEVYDPSEDTFLLLDALEQELQFIKNLQPEFCVEIGSGSGIVITAVGAALQCVVFSTDLNPQACKASLATSITNNVQLECINMDMLTCFKVKFDLIIFNPPYVVTEDSEVKGTGLSRAWAGGDKGRQVTDRLLDNLSNLLTPQGVCYMVLLKDNDLEEIFYKMKERKMKSQVVNERKIRGEHLFVVKFTHIL